MALALIMLYVKKERGNMFSLANIIVHRININCYFTHSIGRLFDQGNNILFLLIITFLQYCS